MASETILGNRYHIIKKLGEGSFGEIFKAILNENKQLVAIKRQKKHGKSSSLKNQMRAYNALHSDPYILASVFMGIPEMFEYRSDDQHNYLTLQLLGPSLATVFRHMHLRFTLKTVLMILDQLLNSIEYIHSKRIIHRDLKPQNICIGRNNLSHKIYIVDYGLSKFYRNSSNQHIPCSSGRDWITGTVNYASVHAHKGIQPSRRDDLQAIAYICIYFLTGTLPWLSIVNLNQKLTPQSIGQKKLKTPTEIICKNLPEQFKIFLDYARSLKFEEDPDYEFLRKMFNGLFDKCEFNFDYDYDWSDNILTEEYASQPYEV